VRVAVIGATGVLGTSAVDALLDSGHDVAALARTPEKARRLRDRGAETTVARLSDHDGLVRLLDGADAVCNLATYLPAGYSGGHRAAWRRSDRLRTEGAARIVTAAREAGVRRIVQESVSFLYADHGDSWVDEWSSLDITPATEPATVAESEVEQYACTSRTGVVLRFGLVVGDDAMTRWQLRAAAQGRPFGVGDPDGWLHPVHSEDIGSAVVASLGAPSGIYNVGAEPVRRSEYVATLAAAAGRREGTFLTPLRRRLAGGRAEPLARSLRVSSERFTATTGWTPQRRVLDRGWFDVGSAVLR
jgi:nucleoside-diphosphate-sugar epimerase